MVKFERNALDYSWFTTRKFSWTTLGLYHTVAVVSPCIVCSGLFHPYHSWPEPPHEETNKVACAPSKDWSAWASAQSEAKTLISLGIRRVWSESSLCTQWIPKDPSFLHVDSEDWSDWANAQAYLVFAGHTCHFVGFVMRRQSWFIPILDNHCLVQGHLAQVGWPSFCCCNFINFVACINTISPNFEEDKGADWFGPVCLCVGLSIRLCILSRTVRDRILKFNIWNKHEK